MEITGTTVTKYCSKYKKRKRKETKNEKYRNQTKQKLFNDSSHG